MPSIEQCEVKSDTIAALPAALEVFDKFKSTSPSAIVNGKDSDSEESFHFTLDDEEDGDTSRSALPNSSVTTEETEEDILNKFDNGSEEATATVNVQDEEAILNESLKEDEPQVNKTEVKVTCKVDDNYADSQDGEFKSVYEADTPSEKETDNEAPLPDNQKTEGVKELPTSDKDDSTEALVQPESQKTVEDVDMPDADTVKEALDETPQPDQPESKEVPSKPQEPDDDADLLDVSMVRETEEDDACAIADALEDQETEEQSNEKSDEEQSDRTDAEPEDNSVGFDDVDSNEASNKSKAVETAAEQPQKEKVPEPADEEPKKCASPKICDSKSESAAEKTVTNEKVCEEEVKMDVQNDDTSDNTPKDEQPTSEDNSDSPSKPSTKRSHSLSESNSTDVDTSQSKKPKLSMDLDVEIPSSKITASTPQFQTLSGFAAFMKCRKLTSKLSRSDLEQFGLQKASEVIMLRSSEGEFHQALRRYEKVIETLRKDMQQLMKQCKDLEIVNKKLMGDIRNQNVNKKPLVPLKITRSVGLQVRLNPGNELLNQARRRQPVPVTPPKSVILSPNRGKAPPTVVRQVLPNATAKPLGIGQTQTTAPSPMLTHALQKRPVVAKRTTPIKKTPDNTQKPTTPGVIDLTDEDDKIGRASMGIGSTVKLVNKPTTTTTATPNKVGNAVNKTTSHGKTITQQGKQGTPSPRPGTTTVANKGNNSLSPGLRLTPTSVITTSANGSPQMVYVVPTLASNGTGQQKVAFVNFQPTNGLTLNGSTMVANKPGQTLTLKTVSLRHKHPAPLPIIQRINRDPKLKPLLPKPHLTIKKIDTGIILQWKMPYDLDQYESIASYQLYAYQETSAPPSTDMWRKVGDVKALALPMACTLTQFADKNKYYFAVRSVDVHKRIGAFSNPEEISL